MKLVTLVVAIIAGLSANALSIHNETSANGRLVGSVANLDDTINTPFIAAVYHSTPGFLCAGVILKDRWIITTAECVYAYAFESPPQVYVEVGGVKVNVMEPFERTYTLQRILIHEEFHSREMVYYNNLALMKTSSSMLFSTPYIAPIVLPPIGTTILPGTVGSLIGWGGTSNLVQVTNLQMATANTVLSQSLCQTYSGIVIEKEFCTDPKNSASACKYDHGSPLFELNAVSGHILLGLVNYAPCTTINYPTIFSNIPDYLNWIANTIAAN